MNLYFINSVGEEKIKQFLLENHKQAEEQTDEISLSRWASEAVDMADINDGQLIVEISAKDCVHDHDVALQLDEDCFEVEVLREG